MFSFHGIRVALVFWLTAGCVVHATTIFTMTGASSPALLTYDAGSLTQTGGAVDPQVGGENTLAFSETGRLFGLANTGLLEFDPLTRAIIHQGPGDGLGMAVRGGTIYTLTGASSPALLTYDANTFTMTGGVIDPHGVGGQNALAFDETGRLFGLSNIGLIEFNPLTLAIIHQASANGTGIAVRNGKIYTLTGTSSPSLLTFDENTFALTAGVNQGIRGGPDGLAFDETGRLFALSNAGLTEFDPTTLAVLHQASGNGKGLAVSVVPEPSTLVSSSLFLCGLVGFSRRRS